MSKKSKPLFEPVESDGMPGDLSDIEKLLRGLSNVIESMSPLPDPDTVPYEDLVERDPSDPESTEELREEGERRAAIHRGKPGGRLQ